MAKVTKSPKVHTKIDNRDIELILALRDRGASLENIARSLNITSRALYYRLRAYNAPTDEDLQKRSTKDLLNKVLGALDEVEDNITPSVEKVMKKTLEWYQDYIETQIILLQQISEVDKLEDKIKLIAGLKVSMADVLMSFKQSVNFSTPIIPQRIQDEKDYVHEKIALYLPKNARFHE